MSKDKCTKESPCFFGARFFLGRGQRSPDTGHTPDQQVDCTLSQTNLDIRPIRLHWVFELVSKMCGHTLEHLWCTVHVY